MQLTCTAAAAPPTATSAAGTTTDRTINTSSGDVNSPTDLLTSTNILVLPPTDTHDTATGTNTSAITASSYSAVKKDYLIQRSVLLLLSIVQHYLSVRSTSAVAGSSRASPYTNTLVVAAAARALLLTMAPETAYVQGGMSSWTGASLPVVKSKR